MIFKFTSKKWSKIILNKANFVGKIAFLMKFLKFLINQHLFLRLIELKSYFWIVL